MVSSFDCNYPQNGTPWNAFKEFKSNSSPQEEALSCMILLSLFIELGLKNGEFLLSVSNCDKSIFAESIMNVGKQSYNESIVKCKSRQYGVVNSKSKFINYK